MAANGIVLITPTSIAHSSGSASINAGGSVTFSGVTSLSLNGVFSSLYDNYIIDIRCVDDGTKQLRIRMRLAGTDNSTASSYVDQRLRASSTSVSGTRTTSNIANIFDNSATQRSGLQLFMYGPALAQPTAGRTVTVGGASSAEIADHAWTHNQSTAYDGCSLIMASGTFTGLVKVYGLVQ